MHRTKGTGWQARIPPGRGGISGYPCGEWQRLYYFHPNKRVTKSEQNKKHRVRSVQDREWLLIRPFEVISCGGFVGAPTPHPNIWRRHLVTYGLGKDFPFNSPPSLEHFDRIGLTVVSGFGWRHPCLSITISSDAPVFLDPTKDDNQTKSTRAPCPRQDTHSVAGSPQYNQMAITDCSRALSEW